MKAAIFLGAILIGTSAAAQRALTEGDWISLEHEPSRHELLQSRVIPNKFSFPEDTRTDSIFGIDLSHYDGDGVPFDQLRAQNVQFVYVKATQGTTFKDPKFAQYWAALDSLPDSQKVYRGAYHFLSSAVSDSAAEQAERFVAYVGLHGGFKATDLAPVVDLEWDKTSADDPDQWENRTHEEIIETALMFLQRVEKLTGKIPMLYTARSWWRERGIPESEIAKFARYPIWVADYSNSSLDSENPPAPGNAKPALWQFSESAKLSGGFPNAVDANIFKGTEEDFLQTFIGP